MRMTAPSRASVKSSRLLVALLVATFFLPASRVFAQTSTFWKAIDIATGSDNKTRMLWKRSNNQITLQILGVNGAVESSSEYGPYPGAVPKAIAVANDGTTRILWTYADGTISLWKLSATGAYESYKAHGPFAGWTAKDLTVGSDGKTRIVWNHTTGLVSLWTVLPSGEFESYAGSGYGPFDGWSATAVAAGNDGKTRILWNNVDGSISVWTVLPSGERESKSDAGFAPQPGWTARDIAVGPDNKAHLLWARTDEQVSLWTLSLAGAIESAPGFGPYAGWSSVAISVGGDGKTRILWNNTNGLVTVWTVPVGGNAYESAPSYGPFPESGPSPSSAKVLFRDDFNSFVPSSDPAASTPWFLYSSGYGYGNTKFGFIPATQTEGGTTFARLRLDTFNPDDGTGTKVKGTEFQMRQGYGVPSPGRAIEFEARVRTPLTTAGVVNGFFPYIDDGQPTPPEVKYINDEIDFEFLGKQSRSDLWLNTWNEHNSSSLLTPVSGLNWTTWHTYKIKWSVNKVEWYVDGSATPIRTVTTTANIPDEMMKVHFNIWSPADPDWTQAYANIVSPTAASNANYYFDVDYLEIRDVPAS